MLAETYHQVLNPKACSCTPEIRKSIIRRLPFLKQASPATLDLLERHLHSRNFSEGVEISPLQFRTGMFGVVASGAFKVFRPVHDEQVVVFEILTAGDFFLYSAEDLEGLRMYVYPDVVQTMTTSCLLTMDQSKLIPLLMQDAHLAPTFFGHLTERLRQTNERFIRFSAFQAEHRLAYLLLFLHAKGPKRPGYPALIPFNLPRKDLAAMAGLTMETTSRILSAMEREGLIRSGRGWVEVADVAGLDRICQLETL
ncbi:MAG: Crp/Fnr family transcriptional regulator [Spirochaetales bacterium]